MLISYFLSYAEESEFSHRYPFLASELLRRRLIDEGLLEEGKIATGSVNKMNRNCFRKRASAVGVADVRKSHHEHPLFVVSAESFERICRDADAKATYALDSLLRENARACPCCPVSTFTSLFFFVAYIGVCLFFVGYLILFGLWMPVNIISLSWFFGELVNFLLDTISFYLVTVFSLFFFPYLSSDTSKLPWPASALSSTMGTSPHDTLPTLHGRLMHLVIPRAAQAACRDSARSLSLSSFNLSTLVHSIMLATGDKEECEGKDVERSVEHSTGTPENEVYTSYAQITGAYLKFWLKKIEKKRISRTSINVIEEGEIPNEDTKNLLRQPSFLPLPMIDASEKRQEVIEGKTEHVEPVEESGREAQGISENRDQTVLLRKQKKEGNAVVGTVNIDYARAGRAIRARERAREHIGRKNPLK